MITPKPSTTSWSPFPPKTAEVQLDEKWAFVGKKQKNCPPADDRCGDCWGHVAIDPESRLVVSLVVGKRTAEAAHALVRDFRRRTGNRVMRLTTSDEYPVYAEAIRDVLIPVTPSPKAIERVPPLLRRVVEIRANGVNPELNVLGVVVNRSEGKALSPREEDLFVNLPDE